MTRCLKFVNETLKLDEVAASVLLNRVVRSWESHRWNGWRRRLRMCRRFAKEVTRVKRLKKTGSEHRPREIPAVVRLSMSVPHLLV